MGRKWFTSDWHVGEVAAPHIQSYLAPTGVPPPNNHSYLRPKPTSELVDEWFAECHDKIKPEDELWLVGDLAITLEDFKEYKHLPPCRRILVMGDKEYNSKYFSKEEFLREIHALDIFDEIYERAVVEIQGQSFFVSHKPKDCWHQNMPAICGHVHGIWRTQRMSNGQPIINVGIDAWHQIVPEEFILHQHSAVINGYYDGNAFINCPEIPCFK